MPDTHTRTQHTPGPWEAYDGHDHALGRWIVTAQPDVTKPGVHIAATLDDMSQDSANARLIAAAPDLLAALEDALDELAPFWPTDRNGMSVSRAHVVERMAAAIAKARGEE